MSDAPISLNLVLFAVGATVIWWAGVRLERCADRIARRTRLGHAFTGMLLLAAATSLPEVAATVVAIVVVENPTLAAHNLLGGVALQTALLVVADRAMRKPGALTSTQPKFVALVQGIGLLLLLQIAIAGVAADGVPAVSSISVWGIVLFVAYVGVMYLTYRYRKAARWTPTDRAASEERGSEPASGDEQADPPGSSEPMWRVWSVFAALCVLVLAGGWLATTTSDALAEQSGLGSAFVGATLLALATSLPELSTTMSAVRHERYTTAISNVFGSNAFDVTLLFLADALYREDTVFRHAEPTAMFVATIGAIMTCIYFWGMLEREDRTVLRVGWDSAAALATYAGGMAVLYAIG